MQSRRNATYDNMRMVLITLVVFAHLLEKARIHPDFIKDFLYLGIYCFHMPAFIFLSGYFGKFSWKRILRLVLMYVLFQTLYCVFEFAVLGKNFSLQYIKPYWILWYLIVLIFDTCLIPVLDRITDRWRYVASIGIISLSLLIGYCNAIEYQLSLSRFFVFLPYFAIGYWAGQHKTAVEAFFAKLPMLWIGFGMTALILTAGVYASDQISAMMLYGSYPYNIGYGPMVRLLLFVTASCWILFLFSFCINRLNHSIPLVTTFGKNTLPIYLLHGFAVKWKEHLHVMENSILFSILCTIILIGLLGNRYIGTCFDKLFRFSGGCCVSKN